MKIRGKQKFDVPRKTVRLSRTVSGAEGGEHYEELTIRVRALPVGTERKMFEIFPEPERPQDYIKDARGMVMRDPDTKKPLIGPVDSPAYAEAAAKATRGRMSYILYNGIDDAEVKFDADGDRNSQEFYLRVFDEMVEFGLTMGDIGTLMTEITGLMNLSGDIEAAKGN